MLLSKVLLLIKLNLGKAMVVFNGSEVKSATGLGYTSIILGTVTVTAQGPAVLVMVKVTLYLPCWLYNTS